MIGYKYSIFEKDLQYIYEGASECFEALKGGHLFLTGGTGFFGLWILESLAWSNNHRDLNLRVTILTRSVKKFSDKNPLLAAHPFFSFIEGDVRDFIFPSGKVTHIIHAATEASVALNQTQPELMFDVITQGTRRVLEYARESGCRRFLLTSSGAVYGTQPQEITHIREDYTGAPDPLNPMSAYGEGKRVSEFLTVLYSKKSTFQAVIARCFAFVGPFLPIDGTFAVGNFIKNGLENEPIIIHGDGTPRRSYLYAADLVIWLMNLLIKGQSGEAYNVGSDEDICIKEIANKVARHFGGLEVKVMTPAKPGIPTARYVPSIQKAKSNIGLVVGKKLDEVLKSTIEWHQQQKV